MSNRFINGKEYQQVRLMYQDEAGFGRISKLGFKNKVFKTLNEVIDKLQEIIQTLTAYQLKSIVHRD